MKKDTPEEMLSDEESMESLYRRLMVGIGCYEWTRMDSC